MKLRPCGHRILVSLPLLEEEEKTDSGIIIANKANAEVRSKSMQQATVEMLGHTAFKDFGDGKPWVKVGDTVMIAKYSGEDQVDKEDGKIYRIINDEDIFAIIED